MDLILQRNDSIQQHWYDHCIKSDHPNSMICPNTTEFYPETEQAEIETEKLKYTIKKVNLLVSFSSIQILGTL